MPYEEDYKMWLEKSLIEMNPDWVCDGMTDKEFTHKWCEENCGKDNAYIMPKCLHMYYHHIVRADRKTEPTISKMEQVDKDINVRSKDEPQIGEMMTEEEFDSMLARVLTGKDEPQTERSSE